MIGYGLIPNNPLRKIIRDHELALMDQIGAHQGLRQPPHVTIKRPFYIDKSNIAQHVALLESFASNNQKINSTYGNIRWFGDDTAYIPIQSDDIKSTHLQLLSQLRKLEVGQDEFDGDKFIAHATIALELNELDKNIARKILKYNSYSDDKVEFSSIGLFMNIDANHWVIISEHEFCGESLIC